MNPISTRKEGGEIAKQARCGSCNAIRSSISAKLNQISQEAGLAIASIVPFRSRILDDSLVSTVFERCVQTRTDLVAKHNPISSTSYIGGVTSSENTRSYSGKGSELANRQLPGPTQTGGTHCTAEDFLCRMWGSCILHVWFDVGQRQARPAVVTYIRCTM